MKTGGIDNFFLLITLCLLAVRPQAQTREFSITIPQGISFESYYGKVSVVDSRYDTLDNGFILNNNKRVPVVIGGSLKKQLNDFLEAVVDPAESKGELLLQLHKFKLVEIRDVDFEYGYCFFRATTYARSGSTFRRLLDVDTIINLRGGDVTDSLLGEGKRQLLSLIKNSLNLPGTNLIEYSYGDVIDLNEQDKRSIRIYTTPTFTNGVYLSYHSFKNQAPDFTNAQIVFKTGGEAKLKVKNKEGRTLRLSGRDIYAFVEKEIPYVTTDRGVCIVEKKNGHLLYAVKDKVNEDNESYTMTDTQLQSLGKNTAELVKRFPAHGAYAYFVSYIDHVDGTFMRVKRIR